MLAAAREAGVQVIWDVLHYGWPDDSTSSARPSSRDSRHSPRAFAEVATRETDGPPWVVPVNEISFFAWAAGEIGIFNPFATRRGDELKMQLLRAAIAAIEAMWAVNPGVRIVHTEPMINVVPHPDRPEDAGPAEAHRQAQYAALDIMAGRTHPELGGREDYLGMIGINYYVHNQWIYPGGHGTMIEPSHAAIPSGVADAEGSSRALPSSALHRGDRHRRSGPSSMASLHGIRGAPRDSRRRAGTWPLPLSDREPSGMGRRPALPQRPLGLSRCGREARDLRASRARARITTQLLEAELRGEAPVSPAADTHLLDVAAHWMEIRSGGKTCCISEEAAEEAENAEPPLLSTRLTAPVSDIRMPASDAGSAPSSSSACSC